MPLTDLYLSTLLLLNFYISTSQIKHSHYILGIIISISHFFFSIVLRQGPPPHLHLTSLYEALQTSAALLLK